MFYDLIVNLSNDMYLPCIFEVAKTLYVSEDSIKYTISVWFLGSAAWQLFLGPLSNTYGKKRILIIGGAVFIASTIICSLTTSFVLFTISRFVQGSTICSVVVAGYGSIHEMFGRREAIKALATIGSIAVLAPAIGPFIGAIISEFFMWQFVFYVLAFTGFISLIVLQICMPNSLKQKEPVNVKRIYEIYYSILTNKQFLMYTFMFVSMISILFLWTVSSPFIVMASHKKSGLYYGLIQACIFSSQVVGIQITKVLIDKISIENLVNRSMFLLLIGALGLFISSCFSVNIIVSIFFMSVITIGAAMLMGPFNRLAIDSCLEPVEYRTAIFSTIVCIAASVSSFIAVVLIEGSFFKLFWGILLCTTLFISIHRNIYYPQHVT